MFQYFTESIEIQLYLNSTFMSKKKIVILTGAGISAESGIQTYRDGDGLWRNMNPKEVASVEAWNKNREAVLALFNERRARVAAAQPNEGHLALVKLEAYFDVTVITQNVDDLHERAGSGNILHLHGENNKVRSTQNPELIYEWGNKPLKIGDKCEKGSQLRPYVVLFGEAVPMMEPAVEIAAKADIFLVVGTSLLVYPAAGLLDYVSIQAPKYIIDPNMPSVASKPNLHLIEEKATTGVPGVVRELIDKYA